MVTSATACAIRVSLRQQALRQHLLVELELEVGHDGDEVGVAGALAVAVDRALHWSRPPSTAASVLATAQPVSLWQWIPTRPEVVETTSCTTSATQPGQHAAVGVAERGHVGAGVVRRAQHLEGVVTVGAVAVEEVLGVEEDMLSLGDEVGDGVVDHRQVLGQGRPQGELDVARVRLGHQRDDRGAAVTQGGDQGVVLSPYAGPPGRPEGREPRVVQVELVAGPREELGVLGVGARPATLDEPDPQLVELARDGQLVGHGEVEPLLLRAVAQRGVVDVERALQVHRVCRPVLVGRCALGVSGQQKRPPVGTEGLRAGKVPAR